MKARKLLWLLPVLAVVGYTACRKTDSRATEEPSPQVKESRFFNEHTSTNTQVQGIAKYLERKNEKLGFVEKTIQKIGYPRWDKAMVIEKQTNQFLEDEGGSQQVTYIPFVRDSQNYVNAALAVMTNPGDTTMSYLCDWQYAQKQNSETSINDTAEHFAVLLMVMDKNVFGHTKFAITDETLFKQNGNTAMFVTLNDNGGRLVETNTLPGCYEATISWQDCPYIPLYGYCYGENGACDNCAECTSSISWVYCEPGVGSGGGSGGSSGSGSGGTGGTGNGGGSGGGSTPPDCGGIITPTSNYVETNAPCTPGWGPVPIEPEEPVNPPCSGIDSYSGGTASLQYILLESRVSEFASFDPNIITQPEQYFVVNDNNGALNIGPVETSTTIGGSMNGVTSNTIMVVHTHPYGGQPSPSAGDFFGLASFGSNFTIHYVIGFNGAKYAMVVNDHIKLQNFVNNNPGAINPDGSFKTGTSVGDAFLGLWQLLIIQGYSAEEAYERAMAHIMKIAGVTMVKAPPGSNIFKKIGIQQKIVNGVPQTDPNGLPIYENADCP